MLGIALWIILALVGIAIVIIYSVEHEHSFGAFLGLLASGMLLHFTGTVNMLDVLHNWQQLLTFIGAYILMGVVWSMIKWRLYVSEWAKTQVENLRSCKNQFLKELRRTNGETFDEIPSKYAELFTSWSEGNAHYSESKEILGVNTGLGSPRQVVQTKEHLGIVDNISRILIWCLYWPFSMLWTLIDDPFKKLVQFLVVHVVGGVFSAISQSGVNEVEKQRQTMIEKN